MKSSLYNNYRFEIRVLVSFVMIFNFLLLFKIFSIQVVDYDKYKSMVDSETIMTKTEQGERGKIYDRNNIELADNITRFDFWVNTTEKFDKKAIANIFSKTFNKSMQYYMDLLSQTDHYLKIETGVEEIYCKNILQSISHINGLRCNSSLKRFYPHDNLTANLVGFFNKEKNNSSGIEEYFDDILSGKAMEVDHQILDNKKIKYNLHS